MSVSPALPFGIEVTGSWDGVSGLIAHVARAIRTAHARRKMRHDYETLLVCDDHILRDIGVTRADVRDALAACRR
jgi:uncharacterized protein YjiS (DUF1127 family)